MIINIRGTSGSGKSTMIHKLLAEYPHYPMERKLNGWKKPKIIGYMIDTPKHWTLVVGSYETQCGGCDSMSYKGSHDDIEKLVREFMLFGNVVFEGLTISSTLSRWQRISEENPGKFIWGFMMTPVEDCHQRILARNGGKEPKQDSKGMADFQRKHIGCMRHLDMLRENGELTVGFNSDDESYETFKKILIQQETLI